uniref:Uncharacterized protein n=1 Tax=Rhizophora mucronata TaxID=61149 RepID=A0A2P2QDB5_RHIMU
MKSVRACHFERLNAPIPINVAIQIRTRIGKKLQTYSQYILHTRFRRKERENTKLQKYLTIIVLRKLIANVAYMRRYFFN